MRKRHTSKEIEAVLQQPEGLGWIVGEGKGHTWGLLRCPANSKECRCGQFCQMSVWSTPKNPERHARKLQQKARACIALEKKDDDDG